MGGNILRGLAKNKSKLKQAVSALDEAITDIQAFDIGSVKSMYDAEVVTLRSKIEFAVELGSMGRKTLMQNHAEAHTMLSPKAFPAALLSRTPNKTSLTSHLDHQLIQSRKLLEGLKELITKEWFSEEDHYLAEFVQATAYNERAASMANNRIFLVHGQDDDLRKTVKNFLYDLGLSPIVLFEETDSGETVIEKFERLADEAKFAVVLLTPDDVGGRSAEQLQARARQNVILELGFFMGRLGRHKTIALKRGEIETPSDYNGVIYQSVDNDWKYNLRKTLKNAGFAIND